MAKSASKADTDALNKELETTKAGKDTQREQQEHIDANVAKNQPIQTEGVAIPEFDGKMTKKRAIEIVNFYSNVATKGTPKELEDARKFLAD